MLEKKVAIVTGAASGIGKAIATLLAKEGARVVLADISEKNGAAAVEEIKSTGGEAVFVKADAASSEDNRSAFVYRRLSVAAEVSGAIGNEKAIVNDRGPSGCDERPC